MLSSRLAAASLFGALLLTVACGSSPEVESGSSKQNATQGGGDDDSFGSSSSGGGDTGMCATSAKDARRGAIDVIFAIDTSASMVDEINQVRQNINAFAKQISSTGLDYNVIVIAERGDPFGICVSPPLAGSGCGDAEKFHHIDVDIDSWAMLQNILDKYPQYSKYLRPEAHKAFIVVSDDNAQLSFDKFDKSLLSLSPEQFGTANSRNYTFNSIVGYKRNTPILSSEKCATAHNTGDNYQRLTQLTGGTVDSVCETSYASVFDNITKGLITKLGCEFEFPKAPDNRVADPTTVKVTYTPGSGAGGQPLTQVTDKSKCGSYADGWYYDDAKAPKKIVFCPTTCKGPGTDPSGQLEVAIGCTTPPPK